MKAFEDLKEVLEDQLKKIGKKNDITPQELEYAYKAVDILKDMEEIKAMKGQEQEGGQSQRGGQGGNSYEGRSYAGGSYARGGRGGYSRENSYAPIWNQEEMIPYEMAMDMASRMSSAVGSYAQGSRGGTSRETGFSREGGMSREYSREGGMSRERASREYSREGSYEGSYDGGSYARGRGGNSYEGYSEEGYSERRGRDARGRYTSRESYESSRHSEKEKMINKLETMADVATDPATKRAIEQCLVKLEQ